MREILPCLFIFLSSIAAYGTVCSDVANTNAAELGEASQRIVGGVVADFIMKPEPAVSLRIWLVSDAYAGDKFGWNWAFGFRCLNGKLNKVFEQIGPISKATEFSKDELSLVYSCEGKRIHILYKWDQIHGVLNLSKVDPSPVDPDYTGPVTTRTVTPKYPPVARDGHHWEGLYVARFHVSERGTVEEVHLERADCRPVDEMLKNQFLDSLSKWEFKPALRKNAPVDAFIALPIDMKLGL